MTNEEKKQWLSQYQKYLIKIKTYQRQIEELETLASGGAIKLKEVVISPTNNSYDPVSENGVKAGDIITKLEAEIIIAMNHMVNVIYSINGLDDDYERLILTMKYINGVNQQDLETEMDMSESSIKRLLNSAIEHLEIKERIDNG